MTIPIFSFVCILLSYIALALGAQPGKGWAFLSIALLLVAGAPAMLAAYDKISAGKELPNVAVAPE